MARVHTTPFNETDCIGDCYEPINDSLADLDTAVQDLRTDVNSVSGNVTELLGGIHNIMNIRMSLSATAAITTTDIKNATNLYIHPYNGEVVSLWSTTRNRWELKQFSSIITVSLASLLANRNYDIYLHFSSGSFQVEFVAWSSHVAGTAPPATGSQNGILVKSGEPNKRLIGCLRTTNAGQTEVSFGRVSAVGGSNPKLFVWNLYNQHPASFSILETGTVNGYSTGINGWTSTAAGATAAANGPFEPFGGANNKVSFISRTPQAVNLKTTTYVKKAIAFYFAYSLNLETPTVSQYFSETPGIPIFEATLGAEGITPHYTNTIDPGYHFLQLVSMTYATTTQVYITWTGDRHSYGTIGTLATY
jgi:hypothetical protein